MLDTLVIVLLRTLDAGKRHGVMCWWKAYKLPNTPIEFALQSSEYIYLFTFNSFMLHFIIPEFTFRKIAV